MPTHRALDDLLAMDADALGCLYQDASVPRLDDLSGDHDGRMLVGPVGPRPAALMRALARMPGFPWRGKTFWPRSETEGRGANRVFTDRLKLFSFRTSIGPSRAGDFDAVQLDYDRPGNPPGVRAIRDEIRELEPGLYLGQAYVHAGGKDRLVLYFGLQRR